MDEALERFKRTLEENPGISAHGYDGLRAGPSRRTLERTYNTSWKGLLELAGIVWSPSYYRHSERPDPSIESKIESNFRPDSGYVEIITSKVITTLEQALEMAEVDLKKWEVDRYTINTWTTTLKIHEAGESYPETRTNYQVKVWLKLKVVSPIEVAIRELIKEIPKFQPPDKYRRMPPEGDFALEMALYDAHFGKLAWDQETMQGDYDIKIAAKWFIEAAEKNLNFSAPFKVSRIIYLLGQDLMHVENFQGLTPLAHNVLDVDSRLPKIYKEAKEATLKVLYMCRQVAPVEVIWIPGNHDMHASFYLSDVIKEHFKDDRFVTVDNEAPWRKAKLWGNLLVGWTHDASGNRQATVTVNMLPQFWPQLWGQSKYREWHTAHKHKKEEMKFFPTVSTGGTIIRQIPTMSVIDAWHFQHGFVDAIPAGESFIWTKDAGICAHYTAHVGHK